MRSIAVIVLSLMVFINAEDWKNCTLETGRTGKCVLYFLCESGKIITDGRGLILPRTSSHSRRKRETETVNESSECQPYIDECCELPDVETATLSSSVPPQTNKMVLSSKNCGVSNGPNNKLMASSAKKAEFSEFPWMAAIMKYVEAFQLNVYQCGGSLIHPKVVLTNARCVKEVMKNPNITYKVRLGDHNVQGETEPLAHQDRDVIKIVIHENFNSDNAFNDIALLFLDKPANLTQNVGVVCLPPQSETVAPADCFASGWGKDKFEKDGKYQTELKKIELSVVEYNKCQDELRKTYLGYLFNLNKSFMCAGGVKEKDLCIGDAGSPLVCPTPNQTNKYMQVGIMSWGIECNKKIPGVYTNVPYFRNWIENHLIRNSIE